MQLKVKYFIFVLIQKGQMHQFSSIAKDKDFTTDKSTVQNNSNIIEN